MRPPVPFGQYVPVDSPVHRLDARVKIALVGAYTVLLFGVWSFPGLAAGALVGIVAVAMSRVSPGLVLRGIRAVSLLLALPYWHTRCGGTPQRSLS